MSAGFSAGDALSQQLTVANGGGMITATLVSTMPPNLNLGLGIGLQGAHCFLTTSTNAVAGAQLSAPADPGQYCVEVYDNGTVAKSVQFVQFVVTITHS